MHRKGNQPTGRSTHGSQSEEGLETKVGGKGVISQGYSDCSRLTILHLPIQRQATDRGMKNVCLWLSWVLKFAFIGADQSKGPVLRVLEGPGWGLGWVWGEEWSDGECDLVVWWFVI